MQRSTELRVMLRPSAEYARLAVERRKGMLTPVVAKAALIAVILGAATSIAALGRPDAIAILSGTLCWAFVPLIQLGSGLAFVGAAPASTVDVRRRLELLFHAHGPWSLWILAVAATVLAAPAVVSFEDVILAALIPSAWTAVLMSAFCRQVLGDGRRRALGRTLLYQFVVWTIIVVYVWVVTQLWPRLLGAFAR